MNQIPGESSALFRVAIIVWCFAILVTGSGCVRSNVRATGIEPVAKRMIPGNYRVLGETEAQSSSFNLLWVFPVTPRISYESAVNDAIARLGGDNLINVRTWIERQIWIGGMVEILHVRGTVIMYGEDVSDQTTGVLPEKKE